MLINIALIAKQDHSHLKMNACSPPLLMASSNPDFVFLFCLFAFNF